jgi:hypothetical protein
MVSRRPAGTLGDQALGWWHWRAGIYRLAARSFRMVAGHLPGPGFRWRDFQNRWRIQRDRQSAHCRAYSYFLPHSNFISHPHTDPTYAYSIHLPYAYILSDTLADAYAHSCHAHHHPTGHSDPHPHPHPGTLKNPSPGRKQAEAFGVRLCLEDQTRIYLNLGCLTFRQFQGYHCRQAGIITKQSQVCLQAGPTCQFADAT